MNKSKVYDYILNLPEGTDFELLDPMIQKQIQLLGGRWPTFPMINTQIVDGRGLLYVRLTDFKTEQEMNQLFSFYNLDWVVLFIRSAYKINPVIIGQDEEENDITELQYNEIKSLDKTNYLPFHPNLISYDMNGNVTSDVPPTLNDELVLSVYSGTNPIVI